MGNIAIKSIGTLIDELCTTNNKIFSELDKSEACRVAGDKDGVGEHYGRAQKMNGRRSALIQAIDKRLGEGDITLTDKTYG